MASGAIGFYPAWLCGLTDSLYRLMTWLGEAIDSLPMKSIDNLYPSGFAALSFTLAVILTGLWLNRRGRISGTAALVSMAIALTLSFSPETRACAEEGVLMRSGKSHVLLHRKDKEVRLYTDCRPQFARRKLAWTNRRAENYYKIHGITPPDTIYPMEQAPAKYRPAPAKPDTAGSRPYNNKSEKSDRPDKSKKTKETKKSARPQNRPPSRKYSPEEL